MSETNNIIGLSETVTVEGTDNKKEVTARIDTGAHTSSIDVRLAADLKLGPITSVKNVKSASGVGLRPIIKAKITINGKTLESDFTIANRDHMKYSVLVGRNILSKLGFLIDPTKNMGDDDK